MYIQTKKTVKNVTRWHKTLSASAISKQVSRCCINFPHVVRHLSPRYGQTMLVSGYTVLTAVNWSKHGCTISGRRHWYTCGADGRKVGRSAYGQMIAKFSRMDRFSKLWGFAQNTELSPWSNKISAENLKNTWPQWVKKKPAYGQVMMVSGCSSLTTFN